MVIILAILVFDLYWLDDDIVVVVGVGYQGALIVGDPIEDEGEDARLRGRHHFFIKIVFNNSGDLRWYDKEY